MKTFSNIVFAGGGSRCMWQMGFWEGAKASGLNLGESAQYICSVSAGCAVATACALDRAEEALSLFEAMTAENPGNIHWGNLRPGSKQPLLPHMKMYRKVLEDFLKPNDLEALSRIKLEFLMARFPSWLPSSLGALSAFAIYGLEKHLTGALHPGWTQKMGFQPLSKGNQDAVQIEDLIEIILASSTVPPVLPSGGYKGLRVLDGGIIDNVPAFMTDDRPGNTLILLSKRYPHPLPEPGKRHYVQPSQAIKIDKFDYANPQGLREVYDLGRADAERFLKTY